MKHQTLLQIQTKNLSDDGLWVEGDVAAERELSIEPDDRTTVAGPVHVALRVSAISGGLLASGHANFTLHCRCDRCLRYYDETVEELPLELSYPGFTADILDLTEDVRDYILLAFPNQNICDEDCRGLCPECGQNLNVRECGCPRGGNGDPVWGALDGFPGGNRAGADDSAD